MATELGKAYVQIIPSAKGIGSAIPKTFDADADKAGRSAGMHLSTGMRATAIAGAAAIGATLVKTISSSIGQGAALQQSLGGVETIFKKSADKVKAYANIAYKTAGMSANSYMENVTSFSASLLQSLGGNTSKAADVANLAMIDMSDNANKFGTNMQDIQNAYQGFAKQNYTMLDNLKLGYGGTQEEMKRLLADATKLTGVKYDINNLSDVYNAIHAIQGKLDITGTTAKEAATTITGSFDSMKAAFQNVLGNLALGNDLRPSLQALAETTSNFFLNNFIPMIGNILKGLPGAIGTFLVDIGPSFLTAGKKAADSLGIGVSFGLAGIGPKIMTTINPIVQGFQTAFGQLPGLFQTIGNAIMPVVEIIANAFTKLDFSGIQSLISAIIPALQAGFTTMMSIMGPAIAQLVESFGNLWNKLQPIFTMLASALTPAFQILGSFLGGVFNGVMTALSGTFDILAGVISFLTPVFQFLVNAFKAFSPVLMTIGQWIGQLIGLFGGFGGAGNTLKAVMTNVWNGIKTAISVSGNVIKTIIAAVKVVFSSLGSAGGTLKNILSTAWNGIKSAISIAGNLIKGIINGVKSVFTGLGSAGNTLKSMISSAWSAISGAVSKAGGTIKSIVGNVKSAFNSLTHIDISGAGRAIMNGFLGGLKSAWKGVTNFVGGIAGWIKAHKGPISYDKKLLIPAGNAIMNGLNHGLSQTFKDVRENVGSMAGFISDEMNGSTDSLSFNPGEINKVTTVDFKGPDNAANDSKMTIIEQLNMVMQLLSELLNKQPKYQILFETGAIAGMLTPIIDNQLGKMWRKNDEKLNR